MHDQRISGDEVSGLLASLRVEQLADLAAFAAGLAAARQSASVPDDGIPVVR